MDLYIFIYLGIASLPPCGTSDFLCKRRNQLFESEVYTDYAQSHIVSAQYYRDSTRYDEYLKKSEFLAGLNNERLESRNATYSQNLSSIDKLVMILFENDVTVVPKESAWFQDYDKATQVTIPLEKSTLYTQNWIGLKKLGENGNIAYESLPGAHMDIPDLALKNLATKYFS